MPLDHVYRFSIKRFRFPRGETQKYTELKDTPQSLLILLVKLSTGAVQQLLLHYLLIMCHNSKYTLIVY